MSREQSFFPFLTGLPRSLVPVFRAIDSETWFEVDLRVTSKTTAIVVVYDIFDNFSGGRGEHLRDVPLEGIGRQLRPLIEGRARYLAQCRVEEEDRAAHSERVKRATAEIMKRIA